MCCGFHTFNLVAGAFYVKPWYYECMSLEGMYRKGVRQIKKRDAANAAHQAQSKAQLESVMRASKEAEAKRYPEPDEGIPCRSCGQRVTGSLDDFMTHTATHA